MSKEFCVQWTSPQQEGRWHKFPGEHGDFSEWLQHIE